MQFHPGVREILKRATLLALSTGSGSVTTAHLLESRPKHQQAEISYERDIPFHPDIIAILSEAAEHAGHDDTEAILRGHLQMALLLKTGRLPVWSEFHPLTAGRFTRLVHIALQQSLHLMSGDSRGTSDGWLNGNHRFDPVHLTGAEMERFKSHALRAKGLAALPVLILLTYAISGGTVSELLRRYGLNEATLSEILKGTLLTFVEAPPTSKPPRSPNPSDFSVCLGAGVERLSVESSYTLALAWASRDHHELTGRDLLRALVARYNGWTSLTL